MSAEPWFVDTNVLVYIFDDDSPRKQKVARELLDEEADRIVLSTQVLSEFYVTVTRKLARPLSTDRAIEALDALCDLPIHTLGTEVVRLAVRRSARSQVSYWDALIIETALAAGATVLLTEDLQDGQKFGDLRVANPLLGRPT
ncbi:MAG: PIN domain-containing protein [Holophagales bacterium]|nr:PIN domain-containing protein [Holophagales bacterium]MYF04743.1 PIN domain-containing protein [Holophagales bacterium]MYJ25671.1 PIN domain-containing protein [Holophagales bacterium]